MEQLDNLCISITVHVICLIAKCTSNKQSRVVDVVCVFVQHEVSSDEETSADDVHLPVSVTDSHMQPVVVLEKLDLTR